MRYLFALMALALVMTPSRAHAIVECDQSTGPITVDECRVTQVEASELAVLEKKPHRTLLVWMDGPSKGAVDTLVNIPWLEQLKIYDTTSLGGTKTNLNDLSALKALTKLRRLVVSLDTLVSVDFLSSLKALEYLDLGRPKIKDLTPLTALDKLTELFITVTPAQAAIVGKVTSLERLDIAGLESLDPLAKLTKLTSLRVVMPSAPTAKSSAGLLALTAMKTVRIISFDLSDLSGLKNMTALDELDVSGTKVSDLTPLAGAAKLRSLYIQGTKVSSLAPLAKLTALEVVDLRDTAVKDFSPLLASAKSLKRLYVTQGTPAAATAALLKANPKLQVSSP